MRHPRNRARPNRMREHFLLCRSAQHHGRNLDEVLIVFRELESCVLEGFSEIIELREIHVAGATRSPILPGECRDGVAVRYCYQSNCQDQEPSRKIPRTHALSPQRAENSNAFFYPESMVRSEEHTSELQ